MRRAPCRALAYGGSNVLMRFPGLPDSPRPLAFVVRRTGMHLADRPTSAPLRRPVAHLCGSHKRTKFVRSDHPAEQFPGDGSKPRVTRSRLTAHR